MSTPVEQPAFQYHCYLLQEDNERVLCGGANDGPSAVTIASMVYMALQQGGGFKSYRKIAVYDRDDTMLSFIGGVQADAPGVPTSEPQS